MTSPLSSSAFHPLQSNSNSIESAQPNPSPLNGINTIPLNSFPPLSVPLSSIFSSPPTLFHNFFPPLFPPLHSSPSSSGVPIFNPLPPSFFAQHAPFLASVAPLPQTQHFSISEKEPAPIGSSSTSTSINKESTSPESDQVNKESGNRKRRIHRVAAQPTQELIGPKSTSSVPPSQLEGYLENLYSHLEHLASRVPFQNPRYWLRTKDAYVRVNKIKNLESPRFLQFNAFIQEANKEPHTFTEVRIQDLVRSADDQNCPAEIPDFRYLIGQGNDVLISPKGTSITFHGRLEGEYILIKDWVLGDREIKVKRGEQVFSIPLQFGNMSQLPFLNEKFGGLIDKIYGVFKRNQGNFFSSSLD